MGTFMEWAKQVQSSRLKQLLMGFPIDQLRQQLEFFTNAFDVQRAKDSGDFLISREVEPDYDELCDKVAALEKNFGRYLTEQKKAIGFDIALRKLTHRCGELKYKDLGKEIYQIEVPDRLSDEVPKTWIKKSATKAVKRFHTPELLTMVRTYQETLETKTTLSDQLYIRLLVKFDHHDQLWRKITSTLAELDALASLAIVSGSSGVLGDYCCRPMFEEVESGHVGFFKVESLKHPCIMASAASDFIPNDIELGGDGSNMILLTGPNMVWLLCIQCVLTTRAVNQHCCDKRALQSLWPNSVALYPQKHAACLYSIASLRALVHIMIMG
jgi:DNA mismatch repair ATPase MutS